MNYYTFEIDGEKVGFFEYEDNQGVLYQKASMQIDGQCLEFPFWVKHDGKDILAYKSGDQEFVSLSQEENAIPSSALLLFVNDLEKSPNRSFELINEGTGELVGTVTFTREGNKIQSLVNGVNDNYFVLAGEKIIEFGWGGGAISRWVSTREEAVAGTYWETPRG